MHCSPLAERSEQRCATQLPSNELQIQAAEGPDIVGLANNCTLEVALWRPVGGRVSYMVVALIALAMAGTELGQSEV